MEELFGLGLGHGWEQLQIEFGLAIQRVDAEFDGVGFEGAATFPSDSPAA